jgi:hypothetical protein
MKKEEVLSLMRSSKNSQEWNDNCDKIKKAHDGGYPDYWYAEVIASGLADETLGQGASKITISTL